MIEQSPWPKYNEAHANREAFAHLARAIAEAPDRETVLDLGGGPLNETRALLDAGFRHVVVVDRESDVATRAASLADDRVEMRQVSFQEYDFPEARFSIVNAVKSLPFVPPADFPVVFAKLKASLKSGGILVGNLFGMRHAFAHNASMTFFEEDVARHLFDGMELVVFESSELDRDTKDGRMHWHTFDFVARKK